MILTETPRRRRVTKLVSWGHWFALVNIIIALVITSIYMFSSPLPGTPVGSFYMITNWLGHNSFLTFFGFVIFILPVCYLLPNERAVRAFGSAVAAVGLALLAFDALLFNRTGLHISFSSADLLRSEAQTRIAEFGWQQWGFLLMLFVVWLLFQLIIGNAIWKRIERLQKIKIGTQVTSFFVLCFVSSHAIHVWADARLYQPIIKQDNMFPLSYPATAKTTMSRYGLLDIENYQTRKQLQFDRRISGINYPSQPVYCTINNQAKALLLIQVDDTPAMINDFDLRQSETHFGFTENHTAMVLSTLFGLPELYVSSLSSNKPVLLDLPSQLGLPVSVYLPEDVNHAGITPYSVDWAAFTARATDENAGLAIGFVTAEQLTSLLNTARADALLHQSLLISAYQQDGGRALLTNLDVQPGYSSFEDFSPTLLGLLGCTANTDFYSTGQNLLKPRRQWLVSTKDDKVIVLHNGLRTEVTSNGNHEIYSIADGERSADALNTSLLTQAIKHLSRFSRTE
ncbi:DUF3413 domain-containing protein [Aestuariibacter salexigens]|uniref:DUF3413 domain-containing protein n=1 Tax=Aestuariibacter salexigens TaxID=226010 RepID=UPI0004218237|nr:DUF3413 domain-containing protein [Aestuariibacter salexigens]